VTASVEDEYRSWAVNDELIVEEALEMNPLSNVERPLTASVDDADNAPATFRMSAKDDDALEITPVSNVPRPEIASVLDPDSAPVMFTMSEKVEDAEATNPPEELIRKRVEDAKS